jgi:hypothetical protein
LASSTAPASNKGLKGTATITITHGGVGPDYASGPHRGECNMNNNAKPVAQFGSVTGFGAVSFS